MGDARPGTPPDRLEETPYLGLAYIGLIVGCVVVAGMLLHNANRGADPVPAALPARLNLSSDP